MKNSGLKIILAISTLFVILLILSSKVNSQDTGHIYNFPPGPKPIEIETFFFLSDINNIDEQEETFEIKGLLEMEWKDSRQAFDSVELGSHYKMYQGPFQFLEVYEGWWPQITIANAVGPTPLENVALYIYHDGTMLLIQEISVLLKSRMNLRRYPFDEQTFQAIFEPMGLYASLVKLVPGKGKTDLPARELSEAGWELLNLESVTNIDHDEKSGKEFSQLLIRLQMNRLPGSAIWFILVPLSIIILLSTSIYWMDAESLGSRMDISFIGLLAIVAYHAMIASGLPKINYFTLTDGFVYTSYGIMVLFVISNVSIDQLNRKGKRKLADKLDYRARWMLPALFFVLNIISGLYFYFT